VPIISFDDALVLYALLTLFGRHGEAAWRGQDDTGRTRAAFRAVGRQVGFRHRSKPCERPALLAHIFVRRHRPPTSGQNASCGGPVRRNYGNHTSWQLGCERHRSFSGTGAPADPLAVEQTNRIDTAYVRGCLSNHAPSLTEARWTTLCTSASFLNGLSSLQCTKQLLARRRSASMSAIWSLTGAKRTCRGHRETDANDP